MRLLSASAMTETLVDYFMLLYTRTPMVVNLNQYKCIKIKITEIDNDKLF